MFTFVFLKKAFSTAYLWELMYGVRATATLQSYTRLFLFPPRTAPFAASIISRGNTGSKMGAGARQLRPPLVDQ